MVGLPAFVLRLVVLEGGWFVLRDDLVVFAFLVIVFLADVLYDDFDELCGDEVHARS